MLYTMYDPAAYILFASMCTTPTTVCSHYTVVLNSIVPVHTSSRGSHPVITIWLESIVSLQSPSVFVDGSPCSRSLAQDGLETNATESHIASHKLVIRRDIPEPSRILWLMHIHACDVSSQT